MSVRPHDDIDSGYLFDGDLLGRPCFYCHTALQAPFVVWMGAPLTDTDDGRLALHPACVLDLFVRLVRDVHEIECKTGGVLRMSSRAADRHEHTQRGVES